MPTVLITSCSNRKFGPANERVSATDLPHGSVSELSTSWHSLLDNSPSTFAVGDLYCGRGFQEAKKSAHIMKADHWVVSAGLGLVHVGKNTPSYDLTVSGTGDTSIAQKIIGGSFDACEWWSEINKKNNPNSLSELITDRPRDLFIIVMPNSYFDMIRMDLASLEENDLKRVRLIGPGIKNTPDSMKECRLPYDDRLDGKHSPNPGTKSDFPQRAAHHFAKCVLPSSRRSSAKSHADLVRTSINGWDRPKIPTRSKKSDIEIRKLIVSNWQNAAGKSTKMLRLLRDQELVQCEQKRFQKLFSEVKTQTGIFNEH